jgi:hypothetical protein
MSAVLESPRDDNASQAGHSSELACEKILALAALEGGRYRPAMQEYMDAEAIVRIYQKSDDITVGKIRKAALKDLGPHATLFAEALNALSNNQDALLELRRKVALIPRVAGPWQKDYEEGRWKEAIRTNTGAGYTVD